MRKEKKIKTKETERKTIYIIGGVIVLFLIFILYLNARVAFKKIEGRDCVKSMLLMEEASLQLKKELWFDVPSSISFNELAEMMAYYYHYGKMVFDNPTTGTLRLKPKNQMANLSLTNRKDRYILNIPKCPAKGMYTLIPSKDYPELFNISCSKHGIVYLPDKEKKYLFTGDIDALGTRTTGLGREADVYFAPEESPKEYVTVIPFKEVPKKPQNQEQEKK
jgi:hypothetical protein